jgi:hypothetical protein
MRIEKINRPEQAVVDRAFDLDPGCLEPIF